MLSIQFTTPTDSFEFKCDAASITDHILVVNVNDVIYEVARQMPQGHWIVDKNWDKPRQNCNMLKRFDTMCVRVTA